MIKEELLQTDKLFTDRKSEDDTVGKAQQMRESFKKRESFKETMKTNELNQLFEEETKVLMGSFEDQRRPTDQRRPGTTGVGARPSRYHKAINKEDVLLSGD